MHKISGVLLQLYFPMGQMLLLFSQKRKIYTYLNGNSRITAFSWGNEKKAETQMLVMHMDVNLMVKVIHFPMFFLSFDI